MRDERYEMKGERNNLHEDANGAIADKNAKPDL